MSQLSNRILSDAPRTLEDAMRSLKKFQEEVEALISLQKQFSRQTASGFTLTVDTGPADAGLKNSPAVPQQPASIMVKDMVALRKNYAVVQELWDVREAMEAYEVRTRQTFAKRGEDLETFSAENARLKLRIDKELEAAFGFLSNLAHSKLPAKFVTFNKALGMVLEKSIQYDDSKQYTYLYEVEGDLCFSTYSHLISVSDDDGTYYPDLFVVSSYRVSPQAADTFVAVLTKFAPPSERLLMRKVTTIKETMRALNMLLSMDNFSTSIGSLPLSTLLKEGTVKRDLFLYQNSIKTIEVDENQVILVLKPEVTSDPDVGRIINQINIDFQQATKKTGTKMSMAVKKPTRTADKCYVVKFFFNPPNDVLWATPEDLHFLKERFRLADGTFRSLLRTINSNSPG